MQTFVIPFLPQRLHEILLTYAWSLILFDAPCRMFEAPAHLIYDRETLESMAGFFNWSMSYRLDSDFPVPYGRAQQVLVLND